jgi:hypothetical protein
MLMLVLGGCVPAASATPASDGETGTIEVRVVAGPVCPVEQDPPDPGCEPRPVDGALILVQPADGRDIVVGQATTDADGHAAIELAAGDYLVFGAEVEGLMGVPDVVPVTVAPGGTITVDLAYDTGIR